MEGAGFVYTDVWFGLSDPEAVWDGRIALLTPGRVTRETLAKTGRAQAKLLHCLPAFHDLDTEIGRRVFERHGLWELAVADDVFQSPADIAFDQAVNRLHTIKVLLVTMFAARNAPFADRG